MQDGVLRLELLDGSDLLVHQRLKALEHGLHGRDALAMANPVLGGGVGQLVGQARDQRQRAGHLVIVRAQARLGAQHVHVPFGIHLLEFTQRVDDLVAGVEVDGAGLQHQECQDGDEHDRNHAY
ncbi:hypothetical protein SDC9_105113 [bioreactor metagenome]|uniref:Uncharacterized protein n=1 Tax=bioreactor metagenome TaxID=1076179 RepID=A0A645AYD4_9ZZZZ